MDFLAEWTQLMVHTGSCPLQTKRISLKVPDCWADDTVCASNIKESVSLNAYQALEADLLPWPHE